MFLSDKDIKELMRSGRDPLGITPYSEAHLTPNGYDMEIEVMDREGKALNGDVYEIKPDELIRVKSVETISIPNGYLGMMLLRSRYTRNGLIGMFGVVDSGFKGKIMASIKNLSGETVSIKLKDGVIHLILSRMVSGSEVAYGESEKSHWQHQK